MIVDSAAPVAIVIPVHNGWAHTKRALQAIRDATGGRVAVVVVDDGSSDGTSGLLHAEAPDVTVIPGSGTLWWSGAANVGCRHAIANGAHTLVLFNNDNYEISDACFGTLLRLVAESGGCVSPVVLEEHDGHRRLRHAGGALDWRRGGIRLRAVGSPYLESDRMVDCDWLPGSALAFSADLFVELDGFDERRFPQYRGDIDFTLRARLLGRRCVVTYACYVVNDRSQGGLGFDGRIGPRRFVSGLVSLKSNYNVREAIPFALRHCPRGLLPRYFASFYSRYVYAALKTWLPHRVRTRLDLAGQRRALRSSRPRGGPACSHRRLFVRSGFEDKPHDTKPAAARRADRVDGGLGGAETFTAELALALHHAGAEAAVTFVANPDPLRSQLEAECVPVASLGLRRGRDVLLRAKALARTVAAQGDFAIVVSSGYLAGALRAAGYGGRIIAVEHGAILQRRQLPFHKRVIRAADRASGIWACDAEVAVSDFVLEHLRARRHARRLVRIYNGVDVTRFRPSEAKTRDTFVVGCTARLVPGKGVDDLIRACGRPELAGSVIARIAGEGPDRPRLAGIAEAIGVADSVEFVGRVADVASFWHGCDLAVVPSREQVESFCLAAVEPMACALPVVGTRNGALPEIISEGRTGTIVAPGDPGGLARAVAAYRDGIAVRERHGKNAREDVERRFDLALTAASYLDLCRALEGDGGGRIRR